jgi:hypothetical protein
MARDTLPFTATLWNAELAATLADTSAAIARLDARFYVSSYASAWTLRASWTGYAAALSLQHLDTREIDIIGKHCGLRLVGRSTPTNTGDPHVAYTPWLGAIAGSGGRHWREDLPFTFDPPDGWREAPALIRALTLLDVWARTDGTIAPWLGFPIVLHRMGLVGRALPCLVIGDSGQRRAAEPRQALMKRLLKQLGSAADDGLARLDSLEKLARRSATVIAHEHRAGSLADLARLSFARPCLAARSLAPLLDITVSGAGKLLERATRLGLLVETSGRGSWRSYVTLDVAQALGITAPTRGRPRALRQPTPALDGILSAFDAEMAALDARLERLGKA